MSYSIEALGWTLVHFCWQAAVIALLYRVADLALARTRSNVRYVLSLAALLSMFAVSLVTLVYEEAQITRHVRESLAMSASASGSSIDFESQFAPSPSWEKQPAAQPYSPVNLSAALPWLDAIWLLGVLAFSARTIGGWWIIQRVRRSAVMEIPATVHEGFVRLSVRLGIRKQIDLRVCDRIAGPIAVGVFRSMVLLPVSALTSLSPEQLEVVLAHELAHIRRADYLWNILQTTLETLFFFHPAMWWISSNLREQRELCCDDVALGCCADPVVYATALLRLEEQRSMRLSLAMALDGNQPVSGLRMRIVRMLGEAPECRRSAAPFSLLGVCATLGLFLLPLPQVFAALHTQDMQTRPETRVAAAQAPLSLVAPEAPVVIPDNAPVVITPKAPAAASPAAVAKVLPKPMEAAMPQAAGQNGTEKSEGKADYIDRMRAAGYDVDLDKYVAMKIQGVTPEYARGMGAIGLGKPSADELVAMKIQGVTPEYVAELKASRIQPESFQDLVSYRIFGITPEFVSGMNSAGFSSIPTKELLQLRIQGVTPEFARATKQQFPDVTAEQLAQLRIFRIDEAFLASAKRHGFSQLTIEKLIRLRISGLLDDSDQKAEKD